MTPEDIRTIIRKEKKRQGIPWRVVAERGGLAPSTVYNYSKGLRSTRLEVAILIMDALGLELCVRRKEREA